MDRLDAFELMGKVSRKGGGCGWGQRGARIESDKALMSIILRSMTSGLELYKEYQDNPSFQRWLQEFVFERTYNQNR